MEKDKKEPKEIIKKQGWPRMANPIHDVSAADKALAVWMERAILHHFDGTAFLGKKHRQAARERLATAGMGWEAVR